MMILRRILVGFGYLFVVVLVVGLTFVLVAYGNDYAYDFSTHKIVQKGHVIIRSVPNGITVTADGKALSKRTPYQAVWSVGQHVFSLTRAGFWPWTKSLEVLPGEVNLTDYAILVPKQPVKTTLDSRTDLVAQAISRDHRHLAYIVGGTAPVLYTLDLGNPKPVKLYTAKTATADTPAEVLQAVDWSDDASHLLLRSTVGSAVTYKVIGAANGDVVDLTATYKFDFSGLRFSSNNWKQLYWSSSDGLRRIDLDAQAVSAVLADKVTQFWVAQDRVLYVAQNDLGRSLWSLDYNGKRQRLIDSLVQSDSYSIAYSTYSGQNELAVVPASTRVGTLYSAILSDTPSAKVVAHDVDAADFSPDGSIVAFDSPTQIVTYDQELSGLTGKRVLATIADQPGKLQQLSWFDDAHLLVVRDGRLYWCEYDGANRVDLGPAAAAYPAWRSSDFKSIIMTEPGAAATDPATMTSLLIRS